MILLTAGWDCRILAMRKYAGLEPPTRSRAQPALPVAEQNGHGRPAAASGVMHPRHPTAARSLLLVQSSSRRSAARSALGGFRSPWVSSHTGDTRRRCWSERQAFVVYRELLRWNAAVRAIRIRTSRAAVQRH